jgi:mRNA interferase MazF
MTAYSRGDVVLVGFLFSDESGKKLRPAVVISSPAYNRARQEVIVAAITSNVRRRLFGDHLLADWKGAGLLFPSVVTGIVRTIKRTMIDRKLGFMPRSDMEAIDRELRRSLSVNERARLPPLPGD